MSQLSRRDLVISGLGSLAGLIAPSTRVLAQPAFRAYPFSLGVASGEPQADGVVLWTRIAPEPYFGGGMPMQIVPVRWEIAADERLRRVVMQGEALARPELAHAVHVEVGGLAPAREYWYRFYVGGEASQTGRAKTLPLPGDATRRLRFGVAGCQNYTHGYFTAYRHLAEEHCDFIFHYGDYIYEAQPGPSRELPGSSDEPYSLDAYRNRYAAYKSDPDLQAAHESAPFLVSFDDHEVDNNWAGDYDQDGTPPAIFRLRRAAALQAYYEHMPLRKSSVPHGADMRMYRRFRYGDLADINVLDTRQYRTDQPCDGVDPAECAEAANPNATMLGAEQEQWLFEGLSRSDARWNVLAQQVLMMRFVEPYLDGWDGALAARRRLFDFVETRGVENLVVLTGDIHSHWAAELKTDFDDERSPTIGCEFVSSSVTSGGDASNPRLAGYEDAILEARPYIKFVNGLRGYLSMEVTPRRWQTHFRGLDYVSEPGAPRETRASFVIENGEPGLRRA